jgi:hypothetical protein
MPKTNQPITNFSGGEISPLMYGRIDAPMYKKSVAKMENFIATPQGPAQYRNGTVFVTNTRLNQPAFLYPFNFSDQQTFVIEATAGYFRFYTNDGIVTGNDTLITGVTNANPGSVTDVAHGYLTGDVVTISDVQGMTQLNGNTYTVTNTGANTYTIGVDTTGYGAYTASGKATQVVGISAITNANPGVITATHHQYSNGDAVFLVGTGAMLLDGQQYLVANVTANTFTLTDLFGVAVNTTFLSVYTSGAVAQRIYEVTTPYAVADIGNLQYAQSADTMYIVNQQYAPYKLIRNANSNWSMATFTRTGTDPFTSAGNWPRSVSFDSAGRLWYGGTLNNPQSLWGSSAPSSGTTAFDDFTLGTAATNSVIFTLAPLFSGKVDYIEWISNTNEFMVVGTFASVRSLWGAAIGSPVTPSAITANPANTIGCQYSLPLANGDTLFFIQRGGQRVRSLEYDFYIQSFTTKDQIVAADHLSKPGLAQVVQQRGYPDIMWFPRNDGKFLGFIYSRPEIEPYAGWFRGYLGGQHTNASGIVLDYAFVNSMAVSPRNETTDQLWFAVTRTINGQQICSVEYGADYQDFPMFHDFYGGVSTPAGKAADLMLFNNAMYEKQKASIYLDMAVFYDGSALGRNAGVALTPSAAGPIGATITLTASAPIFTSAMVGQLITNSYDGHDQGNGVAVITSFIDSQNVHAKVYVLFSDTQAMAAGSWYLSATTINGLGYFGMGNTVSVVTDGGPAVNAVVENGAITLEAPATTVVVGYPYIGTLETLNLDFGGRSGSAQSKPRILIKAAVRFLNSVGVTFGTDYYTQSQLTFRQANFQTDRPTVPFTGIQMVQYADVWTQQDQDPEKKVVILQSLPLPATIGGIDPYTSVSDDQQQQQE